MIKKKTLQTSSDAKRDEIAQETETFLKAGREINQIPYGVSGLDPMGRGKPTTHGQHKKIGLCSSGYGRRLSTIVT